MRFDCCVIAFWSFDLISDDEPPVEEDGDVPRGEGKGDGEGGKLDVLEEEDESSLLLPEDDEPLPPPNQPPRAILLE